MDGKIDEMHRVLEDIQEIKWLIDEGPAHAKLTEAQVRLTELKAAISAIDPEAIRAEARAEALREAAERANQWLVEQTSTIDPAIASTNGGKWLLRLREKQQASLRAAILADEPKEREAEETDIDFVEPTSRDMQVADEVRMCKLGVGAAMRVAKYRIEVERKLKEAER